MVKISCAVVSPPAIVIVVGIVAVRKEPVCVTLTVTSRFASGAELAVKVNSTFSPSFTLAFTAAIFTVGNGGVEVAVGSGVGSGVAGAVTVTMMLAVPDQSPHTSALHARTRTSYVPAVNPEIVRIRLVPLLVPEPVGHDAVDSLCWTS